IRPEDHDGNDREHHQLGEGEVKHSSSPGEQVSARLRVRFTVDRAGGERSRRYGVNHDSSRRRPCRIRSSSPRLPCGRVATTCATVCGDAAATTVYTKPCADQTNAWLLEVSA